MSWTVEIDNDYCPYAVRLFNSYRGGKVIVYCKERYPEPVECAKESCPIVSEKSKILEDK